MNKNMVFVFGSNLRGVHGAGAAKYALEHEGAAWGVGTGHTGNSYAIPTKDVRIMTLPLGDVIHYIEQFIGYAHYHSNLQFKVTQVGCGLAGFSKEDIAPLFKFAPTNCYFDIAWLEFLPEHKFWNDDRT